MMRPIILACIALAGCTMDDQHGSVVSLSYRQPTHFQITEAEKAEIRTTILASMKEPASAKFAGVYDGKIDNMLTKDPPFGCAIVNGKNSFGGFTGNQWVCVAMPAWRESHPRT